MRKRGGVVWLVALFIFGASPRVWGEELQDLKKRVEKVEEAQAKLPIQQGIKPFTAERIHFGGFATVDPTSNFGKSTDTQSAFEEADVDLLLSADITDKLNFFTDIHFGFHSEFQNPNAAWRTFGHRELDTELEIATIRYHFEDSFILELGRMISPFGIINIEHFEPVLLQHHKPQIFRKISEQNFIMFDDHVNGLQLHGTYPSGDHSLGYHAYVSTVRSDTSSVGGGGRLFWSLPRDLITLGVSNQTAQRGGQTYSALGTDLKVKWEDFTFRGEYVRGIVDGVADQTSFYLQPSYAFYEGRFVLFGEVDFLDDTLGVRRVDHDRNANTATVADPIEKFEYTGGINYLPWVFLRTRVEFTAHDYRGATATLGGLNRDYYSVEVSATVSF